jgi:hypothetical protein
MSVVSCNVYEKRQGNQITILVKNQNSGVPVFTSSCLFSERNNSDTKQQIVIKFNI